MYKTRVAKIVNKNNIELITRPRGKKILKKFDI